MPRLKVDNVEPDVAKDASSTFSISDLKKEPMNGGGQKSQHEHVHGREQKTVQSGQSKEDLWEQLKVKFKESLTEPSTDSEIRRKSKPSELSAFYAFPKHVHFAGEQEDEEIILLMRAHLVTTLPWILLTFGSILFLIILVPLLGAIGALTLLGPGFTMTLIIFWLMGSLTFAFLNGLFWYFNVYIVTNERIVDVDWYSLVHREVNISQIKKIQDITANQIGVLSGAFDYGHVFIQTAGTEPNFEFLNLPHPQLVARKIQELLEASGGEQQP